MITLPDNTVAKNPKMISITSTRKETKRTFLAGIGIESFVCTVNIYNTEVFMILLVSNSICPADKNSLENDTIYIYMDWYKDNDVLVRLRKIVKHLHLAHIDCKRIVCFRSTGSSARARARIWSFPKVWQLALKLPAYYVIEVLSQHFDHLSYDDQTKVLIHELLHIPKNFSGSLLPHAGRGAHIDGRRVEKLFQEYKESQNF